MRQITPEERNAAISALMDDLFTEAAANESTFSASLSESVETLFATGSWGFRELLLLIVVVRLLDPSFQASIDFYACNPRAVFEGPMRHALDTRNIPRRQSGPLNVAKGAERLNAQWAAGRRPEKVALELVGLIETIENMSPPDLRDFAVSLHKRFLVEAEVTEALTITSDPRTDPAVLSTFCKTLIDNAPDGGNTLQRIVGYLLRTHNQAFAPEVKVSGYEDRASTTNTTSKKVGDIIETSSRGDILKIYEITAKKFGEQRVSEAFKAVQAYYGKQMPSTLEITVICRAEDVHPDASKSSSSEIHLGTYGYQNLIFQFVDAYEWIAAQLLRMTESARLEFYTNLHAYISDRNTARIVKLTWASLNGAT